MKKQWYLNLSKINLIILYLLIIIGAYIDYMYIDGLMIRRTYNLLLSLYLIPIIYMMSVIIGTKEKVMNKL